MSETFIDLLAKPTTSILIQHTHQQEIINSLRYPGHEQGFAEIESKQIHKKLCKIILSTYQKMMISFQTLCVALQITETPQFMRLLLDQLNGYKNNEKNNLSESSTSESSQEQIKIHQLKPNTQIIETYAVGLLYICHKITDDFCHKYSANVWIENLKLQNITISQIKQAQGKIFCAMDFDILHSTIFNLILTLMEEMKINKLQFLYFTNYLLELYMQSNLSKFIGEKNRIKRITLTFSSVKLACHFLCPNLWKNHILKRLSFGTEQVQKYSRVLFGMFLEKSRNVFIHKKYQMKRFKQVSNLKVISCQKTSSGNLKINSLKQFSSIDQKNRKVNRKPKVARNLKTGLNNEKIN